MAQQASNPLIVPAVLAFIKMSMAIAGFIVALCLPLLFLRFMEWRSGDSYWLYHKLFRKIGS